MSDRIIARVEKIIESYRHEGSAENGKYRYGSSSMKGAVTSCVAVSLSDLKWLLEQAKGFQELKDRLMERPDCAASGLYPEKKA